MSQWVRLWEDMPDDPKWRVIAKRSGRPLHMVIAVFTRMLISAAGSSVRGTLEGWDDEDAAIALDMEELDVQCIRNSMQGKVLDGDVLTGWEKRQPKREDNSADRVAALRERRNTSKRDVTPCNAPEKKREDTDKGDANASLVGGEPPTLFEVIDSQPELPISEPIKLNLERDRIAEARSRMRKVAEAWNDLAGELHLPQIEEIKAGSPREKSALARIREGTDFDRVFTRIRGSPFLRGDRGHSPAAFDWIMNPTNLTKILEGNYEDRKAKR